MGGMTQEISEIFILLASSLGREMAQKKCLCCFGNIKGPLHCLAYLCYPWLDTWTADINVDELLSGWGKERGMSQINESSLCGSQLFLSQQVRASMTACAIIFTETVVGFYLTNCVVSVVLLTVSLCAKHMGIVAKIFLQSMVMLFHFSYPVVSISLLIVGKIVLYAYWGWHWVP